VRDSELDADNEQEELEFELFGFPFTQLMDVYQAHCKKHGTYLQLVIFFHQTIIKLISIQG
jgi:hypothetical protein